MNCADLEQHLSLYLYDELSAEERAAWEVHVAGCERCRGALEESRRLHQVLSERMTREPSPDLLVRCRQGLEEALDREEHGWRALVRGWFAPAVAHPSRLAAALTLVAFGFSLGWIIRPRAAAILPYALKANVAGPITAADLGGARINSISQVAPDPQTGEVRITLNAERRVTMEGSLDDPRIRQVLVYAVKSYDNPGIRLDTLNVLRRQRDNPSVQQAMLYAMNHDPNAGMRLEALNSVGKMSWNEDVKKALLAAAERDANLGVRDGAVDQLARHAVEGQDEELIPELKRLAATDTDRYVRMKSVTALHELGQEPF